MLRVHKKKFRLNKEQPECVENFFWFYFIPTTCESLRSFFEATLPV
jgi:hypothetical protein